MRNFVGIDIYFEQSGRGSHVNLEQSEEGYQVLRHLSKGTLPFESSRRTKY